MAVQYKCPNCGAIMVYDGGQKKLICEYCDTTLPVPEVKEEQTDAPASDDFAKVHPYFCPNCGGQIMTDEYTAATHCAFCGGALVLEDRLSGKYRPAYLIPFQYTKETAKKKFREWTKKGFLTPGTFYRESTLEKIQGIYVPYWMYDIRTHVDLEGHATRTRSMMQGDTRYIYTDHFLVRRSLVADYERVPADASIKMPDETMDLLEPFQYAQLTDFDMPYLSGYHAEKYNYTADEMQPRVEQRVREYASNMVRETVSGYETFSPVSERIDLDRLHVDHVMFPVWMMHCRYRGKDYSIAMNGQTGKTVGELPLSMPRAALLFCISALLCFIIGLLIMMAI